jgi:beta-lactamase superfamily II metal-dependent hydrolase
VAALPTLFEHYEIGRLITNGQDGLEISYQELLSAAGRAGTPVHEAIAGEVIIIDESPIPDPHLDNNSSVAFKLIFGGFSLLITGDAGAAAEGDMIAGGNDLASVVYKAGHHGSDTSSSRLFLIAVAPDIAVISSGVDNQYGHPHPAVLARLSDAGAAVLRTDELGTIEVITDGDVMWWEAGFRH